MTRRDALQTLNRFALADELKARGQTKTCLFIVDSTEAIDDDELSSAFWHALAVLQSVQHHRPHARVLHASRQRHRRGRPRFCLQRWEQAQWPSRPVLRLHVNLAQARRDARYVHH